MSKYQPPILNNDICRASTDKQTHKYTKKKHTKTETTLKVKKKKKQKCCVGSQGLYF